MLFLFCLFISNYLLKENALGASVVTMFEDMASAWNFYAPIELGDNKVNTWPQWKIAMSNTTGLQNITNYQVLICLYLLALLNSYFHMLLFI